MLSNVSLPVATVWNEKTVLTDAIPFLTQKKDELNQYHKLWEASVGTDYYSRLSTKAGEKFKATAEKSKKEIQALDNVVAQLLDAELAKNPLSEQAEQLLKISLASRHGLNYFASAVKDIYYPTNFNWVLREAASASRKLAFCATVITGATNLAENITSYQLSSYSSTPWKVSMAACIAFSAISYLNHLYRVNICQEWTKSLKHVFEQAIAPEKAVV
jgi:hypothetical protein